MMALSRTSLKLLFLCISVFCIFTVSSNDVPDSSSDSSTCSASEGCDKATPKLNKRRLIVDTDPGLDDAFGLLWVLEGFKNGLYHLEGITTIDGNIDGDKVFSNTVHMVNLSLPTSAPTTKDIRRSLKNIPVAKQNRTEHQETDYFFGEDGMNGITSDFKDFPNVFSSRNRIKKKFLSAPLSEDFIIKKLQEYPHQISLLCFGPISNLHLAETKHPGILSLAKDIYIMGGTFGKGNADPLTEFNFHYDPKALYEFFETLNTMNGRVPNVFLLPLDVTTRLMWGASEFETLYSLLDATKQSEIEMCRMKMEGIDEEVQQMYDVKEEDLYCTQTGLMYHFIEKTTEKMIVAHFEWGNGEKMELHDPAVVGIILYPHLFEMKHVQCKIDRQNGMVYYDQRLLPPTEETMVRPNCFVVTDVDVPMFMRAFTRDFLEILKNL